MALICSIRAPTLASPQFLPSPGPEDVYPFPGIDDILDTLGGAQYFSTLDLSSGYWQIELDPCNKRQN
jgi:hypothetical protein